MNLCIALVLCLLCRLLDSPLVFCVSADVMVVDVVAVVVVVALFGRFRRIFSTWPRVHVPARFAPLLTCCKIRLPSAVKSKNDILFLVRMPPCWCRSVCQCAIFAASFCYIWFVVASTPGYSLARAFEWDWANECEWLIFGFVVFSISFSSLCWLILIHCLFEILFFWLVSLPLVLHSIAIFECGISISSVAPLPCNESHIKWLFNTWIHLYWLRRFQSNPFKFVLICFLHFNTCKCKFY